MEDAKRRSKALKTAVGLSGVISASLDKDCLIVVGDGVDSVELATVLRRKMVAQSEWISAPFADSVFFTSFVPGLSPVGGRRLLPQGSELRMSGHTRLWLRTKTLAAKTLAPPSMLAAASRSLLRSPSLRAASARIGAPRRPLRSCPTLSSSGTASRFTRHPLIPLLLRD
ncbi:hypothetical protein ZIOFF_051258 [Zingiber officinale]|uniref:Uncharacterized protein n=1 Tax=Zingiber officinale TaxID=94328 RepID=A0A8J5KMT3_ZINOF|nr:hypothetical protein ZIOFF_051258 [Zingiber officinale]